VSTGRPSAWRSPRVVSVIIHRFTVPAITRLAQQMA
jgi:hypothetical protein